MLYPCFVAKAISRYTRWKEQIIDADKRKREIDASCLRLLEKEIFRSVEAGETGKSSAGYIGRTVKYIVPRIRRLGYSVSVFDDSLSVTDIEKVQETGYYSILVMWGKEEYVQKH
ncbi:MAG: hypothetical protein M0P12_00270 [Paludibacteraceae bacterium]|nr:hypothetical protein [Paludibacteraceae bacterium]